MHTDWSKTHILKNYEKVYFIVLHVKNLQIKHCDKTLRTFENTQMTIVFYDCVIHDLGFFIR